MSTSEVKKNFDIKLTSFPLSQPTKYFSRMLYGEEIKIPFIAEYLHNNLQSKSRVTTKDNKCAAKVLNRLFSQIPLLGAK